MKLAILIEDLSYMLSTKFRFNWVSDTGSAHWASSLFENTKFDIKWSERLEKIEMIFDAEILTKEILRMNKSIEPKLISCG
jgi:hypothetical protein